MLKRIMVVEAQDAERQSLVSTLSQAGYEVMSCADVVTAARAVGHDDFDLLVTNIGVRSDHDGVTFIRFIYKHCNGLIPPVLVVGDEKSGQTAGAIPGVVGFLSRPYDSNILLERVRGILDEREKISPQDLQARLKQVLNGSPELPTLPEARLRVLELTSNLRESDPYHKIAVAQVAAVVRLDPPLCGHLISRANRVLVRGRSGDVKTALAAVNRLGLREVHGIAVATSVLETARLANKVPGFDPKKLWIHSVACAANAEVLSNHLRLDAETREMAFVAGILHDIGKILVCKFFPDFLAEVLNLMRQKHCSMAEAEQQIGGVTHATVGAHLAQRWALPQILAMVIASHHVAGSRGASEIGKLTSVVQIADAISYQLGMGFGLARVAPPLNPEALRSLGLRPEDIEGLKPAMSANAKELIADLPF